jgi:hypothetical protein
MLVKRRDERDLLTAGTLCAIGAKFSEIILENYLHKN